MESSPPSKSAVAVTAAAAIFLCALSKPVLAGDNLADRTVLPTNVTSLISGSTYGMSIEPGEIDESGAPAGMQDRSVWYEWTPSQTGAAFWKMDLSFSTGPMRGIAAYIIAPEGGPVTMSSLVPAGAAVLPAWGPRRGIRLWVTTGQKIILRVWTAPDSGGSEFGIYGQTFTLTHSFTPANGRQEGDISSMALDMIPTGQASDGSMAFYGSFETGENFTTEAADTLIGAAQYPAGAAYWYRWQASLAGPVRFSLTGRAFTSSTLLVAERRSPGGALDLVSGPGTSLTFTPEQGKEYLIRVAIMIANGPGREFYRLQGALAEAGDELSAPRPLAPGGIVQLNLAGASPTRLPTPPGRAFDNQDGNPDVWLDLGSNLSGLFSLKLDSPPYRVTLYTADAAGNFATVVAGGSQWELPFLAEAGQRYMARVAGATVRSVRVSLTALTSPPPSNDRRSGAELLPANGPVMIYGNATGATSEESDWPATLDTDRGRTVWYALDRPVSTQRWYACAWNNDGTHAWVFREENGVLVSDDVVNNKFLLTGTRVWIMVSVEDDPRFILMAGPAVAEGDDITDAVPLTARETRFLYVGAATENSPAPGGLGPRTQWLAWTAQETGVVVVSTGGSGTNQMNAGIFTAALEPVFPLSWVPENLAGQGEVLSFGAWEGVSYRIVLHGFPQGVAIVRLQPGGWESPWDMWLHRYPAWKDEPSLTNPAGDADGDGVANLMEMAFDTSPVVRNAPGFPMEMTSGSPGLRFSLGEASWALRGAEQSRPFKLFFEGSSDLNVWTEEPHTVEPVGPHFKNHFWEFHPMPGVDPPHRYFRMRVSR